MAIGVIGNDEKNKLLNLNLENKYGDVTYEPKLNNENDCRSYICKEVKKGSVVLDLGCAQGFVGMILRNELNCTVYGIELDKGAIAEAKETKCYEKIYNFDISDDSSNEYKNFFETDLMFDYIIFSDVLEHLIDPAKVIYSFGVKLKERGKILISLPNIAHYDIVNGLLNETFNYSDRGLLDSTHLRFFTRFSFAEYIDSANQFYDIRFDCTLVNQTKLEPCFMGENPYLDEIISTNKNLFVLQNIFELKKLGIKEQPNNLKKMLNQKHTDVSKTLNKKLFQLVKNKKNYEKKMNKLENQYEEEKLKNEEERQKYEDLMKHYNRLQNNFDYIYNEYNKMLFSRSWKLTKPIRKLNEISKNIRREINVKKDYKKSVLIFVHAWINVYDKNLTNIGGTTMHVLELIKHMSDDVNFYVLTTINDRYMLVTFVDGYQYIYDLNVVVKTNNYDKYDFEFINMLNELIERLKIDIVHIHHLLNFPCDLQYITRKVKKIVTVHDYYMICPRYFLVDSNNKCCMDKSTKKCKKCMKNTKINIDVRENAIKNFIKTVDKFIVPDESVAFELRKYVDLKNCEVIPHGMNFDSFTKFEINDKNKNKVKNIAFIGIISEHKGLDHMRKLINENSDPNIVYHLFGWTTDEKLNESKQNYIYHGLYNNMELPKLLNDNKIDLVLLLSTCLESFSYTLSESLYAKIPVLVFDIGALGNRVKKYGVGWTLDKDSTYKDIIEMYDVIFDDKEYNEKLSNVDKYSNISILQMINKVSKIYDIMYVSNKKNYLEIEKQLDKYYLKYKI